MDVPMTVDVWHLLKEQRVSDTYYKRGDGQATQDLEWVEATHRNWVHDIIDLSEFPHCYFVNGTTDAIHHWLLTEDREYQYYEGEYEYPQMIKPGHEIGTVPNDDKVLYVSCPNSATGNYIDLSGIECPVILDCTYVTTTYTQEITPPKNTEQVFFSFSKGFGLVGQRIGLVYTKEPHKTLQTLKDFENWNYGGVKTIDLIMANYDVDDMWNEYYDEQLKVCDEYGFEPSDCYFLANSHDEYYKRRRRTSTSTLARLCITSLMDI